MQWGRRPACLWGLPPLSFHGQDALSSQAGGPRHYFRDTLSWRDFVAHQLAGLIEPVPQFVESLLGALLHAVPGGFGGVPRLVKLLAQPICLLPKRLKFGFGFGLGRVA